MSLFAQHYIDTVVVLEAFRTIFNVNLQQICSYCSPQLNQPHSAYSFPQNSKIYCLLRIFDAIVFNFLILHLHSLMTDCYSQLVLGLRCLKIINFILSGFLGVRFRFGGSLVVHLPLGTLSGFYFDDSCPHHREIQLVESKSWRPDYL